MSWKWVKIKDICFIHGGNPSPKEEEFASEGIPFIKMKDLGKYHHTTSLEVIENRIPLELFNSRRFKVIKKGSVIIPRSGSVGLNHRGILAFDSVIVSHICALEIIDDKLVFNKFLYYYLTTIDMVKITKQTTGLDAITFEDLAQIQIPLPPLATQKRIAEILDAADALRRKDQELLKKYDELAQAIFIDMFGDPVKNEKGWEVKTIDEVATKVTDGDHLTPIRSKSGYKLLSCRNVKNGYIDFEAGLDFVEEDEFKRMFKRCNPEKGDILVSCSGTIGRVTQIKIDEKFVLVRSAALIKPDQNSIISTYLEYYLQTDFMQREMHKSSNTSSQANLFTGPIKALPVLIPSKNIQEKFAAKIQMLEHAKSMSLKNNGSSSNLFDSLIHKAFKGELVI
jgi:type I restriction enzyme S subunit